MTAKVTLHQLGMTEVRTVRGRHGQLKELKLRSYEVHLDGEKVGRISSYIARTDLTPGLRTRMDGVGRVVWYNFAGKTHHATDARMGAVQDVLLNALCTRGVAYNDAWKSARDMARAARAGRPVSGLKK